MNQRKERGITLVALVITIIVMLILAGVAISTITTGGIPFGKIKKAVNEYNQAVLNEANEMNEVYGMLNQAENNTPDIGTSKATQVNAPVLVEGMPPIIWDEAKQEWVETIANASWYSYEEQTGTTEQLGAGTSKWANVRMPDGSMFVWIPRYAYQISNGYHTGGSGVKGVIDVVFMKDTTYIDYAGNTNYGGPTTAPTYSGDKQTNWIVHPVFRANAEAGGWTTELSGIWVAKFEATEKNGNVEADSDSTTYQVQVLPNKVPWRSITASNMYKTCQNATYGYSTKPNAIDSHMMKNTEWGAVAYLAHSKYGRNGTEVSINNASGSNSGVTVEEYTTGYSGGTNISASKKDITYSYETLQGQLASTTGNIYGIYDMSGGTWEYVAGIYRGSGVSSETQAFYTSITNAAGQYKNTYTNYNSSQYGDALYETSNSSNTSNGSWYADYSSFIDSSYPVFSRGGGDNSVTSGGLFFFNHNTGYNGSSHGFRPVLVVSAV